MSPVQAAVLHIDGREAQIEKFRAWLAKVLERAERNVTSANKKARSAALLEAAGYCGDPDAELINASGVHDALAMVADEFRALCPPQTTGDDQSDSG